MDVRQQRRTLWSTLMGIFVTAWPSVILIAALPTIAASLDTDATTLAWVITLPLLVSSVLLPTFGRLGDLHGHRRVFLWGLGLSVVTAGMTALAWDAWSLILFRTLSQTAGVATVPTAIALIMAAFEPKDRPRALGAWSGVTAFSPALGLMFGGPLVAALGWRGVFVMQMLLAAAFFPMCRRWLRETPLAERVRFDVLGGVSLMVASGSVLFFFDRAAAWGWTHPSILVAALVFPVALAVFVRAERRATDPLLPPGLFRSRQFNAPVGAEVLSIVAGNGAFFAAPLLLTEVFDTSVVSTSFLMLPLPLGMAVGSPVGGRVAVRLGERAAGTIGAVAMTAAMGLFLAGFVLEDLVVFVLGLVVMGLSHGMMRPATASAAGNALQPEFFGVGMATMRMTSQLGGAAGISIAVTATALGGFGWYYAIAAVVSFASVVVVRFVISQRPPVTAEARSAADDLVETETALTISPVMEG
ncbi:MAG: MFS transporter [Acidimicrobiales bacterium]|nr:MFS transporter [Acidimicrobiales bacterium]